MARSFVVLLLLALALGTLADSNWGYDDASTTSLGPSFWGKVDSRCDGQSQSPIDVRTKDVIFNPNYGPLSVSYSPDRTLTLANNGHTTVVSDLDGEDFIDDTITAPGLLFGKYRLGQFHLHWGQSDTTGSEHKLNGVGTPAELHLVHYNTRYANVAAAAASGKSDALAVVGIFFRVGDTTPSALAEIIKVTPLVMNPDTDESIIGPLELASLLPRDLSYFTYSGSLTTPTCNQVVRWILLENAMTITQRDLDTLRATLIETSPTMAARSSTFRPVQPLNNRLVYRGVEISLSSSDATSVVASSMLLLAVALLAALC